MLMEIIFLGTSCMVPTVERNHQSVLLSYLGEGILIDCGEGTQRQLKIAKQKPTKIKKILISHWHGDHVLGIPGLLQTMNASNYEGSLEIFGPPRTKKFIRKVLNTFVFDNNIEIKVIDIKKKTFYDGEHYSLEAVPLKHRIPCLGFAFVEKDRRKIKLSYTKKLGIPEGPLLGKLQNNQTIKWKGKIVSPKDATYIVKGKRIAFVSDTVYCNGANVLAKDSDLLICEAAYTSDLVEKAKEYMHLTASEAAQIASQNNVKELILTHFSQRYKTSKAICEDAKTIFDNVSCAYDFMKKKM